MVVRFKTNRVSGTRERPASAGYTGGNIQSNTTVESQRYTNLLHCNCFGSGLRVVKKLWRQICEINSMNHTCPYFEGSVPQFVAASVAAPLPGAGHWAPPAAPRYCTTALSAQTNLLLGLFKTAQVLLLPSHITHVTQRTQQIDQIIEQLSIISFVSLLRIKNDCPTAKVLSPVLQHGRVVPKCKWCDKSNQ